MQIVIDIPKEMYKNMQRKANEIQAEGYTLENAVLNSTPLEDIRSKILYEIYMDGVNMDNEYHGCWVRFKNIETIVNRYMKERSEE